jgi:ornithine cyclodeaminase/alanine dehydrogenase-like protein (mu-crystallin family)
MAVLAVAVAVLVVRRLARKQADLALLGRGMQAETTP